MALENLSTNKKKAIVVLLLIGIIALKVIGIFKAKLPFYLIVGLGAVSVLTDATPVAAGTLDSPSHP